MADIKITFAEVTTKAGELRTHNKKLDDNLAEIKRKINALKTEWTSDTSETVQRKINGMQQTFDTYKEVIESYAKFLDDTVRMYENTESTLNSNAESKFL